MHEELPKSVVSCLNPWTSAANTSTYLEALLTGVPPMSSWLLGKGCLVQG